MPHQRVPVASTRRTPGLNHLLDASAGTRSEKCMGIFTGFHRTVRFHAPMKTDCHVLTVTLVQRCDLPDSGSEYKVYATSARASLGERFSCDTCGVQFSILA